MLARAIGQAGGARSAPRRDIEAAGVASDTLTDSIESFARKTLDI